jgi:hypothetical protein
MEVHSHTHTERKKFTHYLWEFLMLFLAVFCGFLAENIREHSMEHSRAKEFAALMYEDLKKDTAFFRQNSQQLTMIKGHQDSLGLMLKKDINEVSNYDLIKQWINSLWALNFTPQQATYEQMKNSGSLRYIKNIKLINVMQEYYNNALPVIVHWYSIQSELTEKRMLPFLEDHINYQEVDFFTSTIYTSTPQIFDWNKRTAIKLYNMMALLKEQNGTINRNYDSAGKKAIVLMELLQKEYALK